MARYGLLGNVRPYHLMVDSRFNKPGRDMVRDVVSGEIDPSPVSGRQEAVENAVNRVIWRTE